MLLLGLGIIAGGSTLAVVLVQLDRTPRELAPYLQRRAQGHRPAIVSLTDLAASWLIRADRLATPQPFPLPASLGAAPDLIAPAPPSGRLRHVSSLPALAQAIATAQPGDVIELDPGHYRFSGSAISLAHPGTALAPILLRVGRLGDAVIESDAVETFRVTAPFWRIENLQMRGVCGEHRYCEHAFHVVAGATDVVIRNNRLSDYNAHIKINGEAGQFPDRGLIEHNTFTNTVPRNTDNPVTPIDLVAASDWHISGNIITDSVRAYRGGATYGAFVKGAGAGNVFERNLVICEWRLHGPGEHVGLSLGGGGTGLESRREHGRTGLEQIGGVIRDNLIAACSDDGIYLNRAARSVVDHNTLLDTAGIDARFVETSATITANIVDGVVRARDGAGLRAADNAAPFLLGLFVGWHPQRGYFNDPTRFDLTWRDHPDPLPDNDSRPDLCGQSSGTTKLLATRAPGAFGNFADCLTPRRDISEQATPAPETLRAGG